jgi:hypothetical protein
MTLSKIHIYSKMKHVMYLDNYKNLLKQAAKTNCSKIHSYEKQNLEKRTCSPFLK